MHPLDLIKTRYAINDGRVAVPQYQGLKNAFVTIFKQEGFRGYYKGLSPNAWGSGIAWGCYFLSYNAIKEYIQAENKTQQSLGPAMHMLAASEAGIITLFMTNPILVVKTRLCLQYENNVDLTSTKNYRGMMDGLFKIYRTEGLKGLYSGFVPGVFGTFHGAIQFMTYEEMKNAFNQYKKLPIDTKLSTYEYLIFAAISKLIAASSTYPYQVIRTRLQDQHHSYKGALDCIKQTYKYEKIPGFYLGLKPYLLYSLPKICLVMLFYEKISKLLS